MADASYIQTSFLGGEWSPFVQGRMDDPRYRTGLNVCRNTLPLEEGAATRRPGTRMIGATRKGVAGVLRAFDFKQSHPYLLELTAGHLRFIAGTGLVVESAGTQPVLSVSAANPAVLQTGVHGWATGDQVIVQIDSADPPNSGVAALLGRQLQITVTDTSHFSVADALTGVSLNGALITLGTSNLTVSRIADFVVPYASADLQAINTVQDQTNLLLLHGTYKPYLVNSTSAETTDLMATFTVGAATFTDGPYLDPPTDGSTITPSALTGSVTLTLGLGTGSAAFKSTDVGRMVRLFSEPAAWAIGTAYAVGDQVKFNNSYYQAVKANTGKQPDVDIVNWGVATTAAAWSWATITAYTDATHVTATIKGDNLLRTTAQTYRLGVFSDTTGWPSCGVYHEGRLWLSGVVGNRIDGSKSNDLFNFSPTAADGTVADNNAIAAVFNATDVNQIYWMVQDARGIICGTQAGEWLVQASQQNDPLTPTSIQAHRQTTYGAANVRPQRAGLTICFVQRFSKKVLEYITTDFRGLSGHNISVSGKHLTQKGIAELAYQREKLPVLWARTNDGQLIGCTYKRESPFASEPADFTGWHHHDLGSGMTVYSIQTGPNFDGSLDALTMVVKDAATGYYYSQLLTDVFDVDWTIGDSMFVDFASTPSMIELVTSTTPHVLRLYSLHRLAGKTVDVFLGGIDAGSLVVAADGHLDVPIDNGGLLTSAWLASLTTLTNFHGLGLSILATPAGQANTPALTGIQNFDTTSITNYAESLHAVDWDNNRLFLVDTINGEFVSLDITTLAKLNHVTVAGLTGGLIAAGEDGYLYSASAAVNCSKLHKIDPVTLTEVASFGVNASGFNTTATTWAVPADMDTVQAGSKHFLVSCASINAAGHEVTVLNLDTMSWALTNYTTDEITSVITRGKPSHNVGRAHLLSFTTPSQTLGLYTVTVNPFGGSSFTKVGLVNASGIPGWTHFDDLRGVLLDETDGNIIAHVGERALAAYNAGTTYTVGALASSVGHDYASLQNGNTGHTPASSPTFWQDLGASTTGAMIVKINVHTCAAMWSVAILASIPGPGQLNDTRVRNGLYCFLDNTAWTPGHHNLHQINTVTGVNTPVDIIGVVPFYQTFNDQTGEVMFDGQFSPGGGAPVAIGSLSFWSKQWATFGPAAGPIYPAAAAPTAGVYWTVPAAIGFTYPSQGQILRPILPQETGAQNGPALGKTRRSHMYSALLQGTQGIKFGTVFTPTKMHAAQLRSPGGNPFALTALYSGVLQDVLEDDYTFDSMLCWEIDRPYPATVCTLGAFLHTQDR